MNIGKITQNFFTNSTSAVTSKSSVLSSYRYNPQYQNDSFEISNPIENHIAKKILSGTRKFSVNNYNKLNAKEINALRTICNKDAKAKDAAKKSLDMALLLKPYLDKKYGEDKYVFVSIGRSPVGIARAFEFMGVETKYLPISHLRCYPDYECVLGGANGLDKYGNFLKKQGINNFDIELSDKQYLFFDYTYTGKSLNFFEKLLKKGYKINQRNMQFLSIGYQLAQAADETDNINTKRAVSEYITRFFNQSGIEPFGGISELKVSNLDAIKECAKFSSPEAKIFNFLLIDALNKKGLLKENKKNRKSL